MIASLSMYDRPETARANDALWAGIRDNLGYGPAHLDRCRAPMDIWQSPDLLFSLTCSMPYRLGLHETVQLVGTPDYRITGARAGYYFSALIVRTQDSDDMAGYGPRVFAYNEATSQSGWAAPQNHAQTLGFQFENLLCSGGHRDSAAAVAEGRADIAAIDAVSWRMICEYEAWAGKLKVIETTTPTPGLPYITATTQDADEIFAATEQAIDRMESGHKTTLGIAGIIKFDPSAYMGVPSPAPPG